MISFCIPIKSDNLACYLFTYKTNVVAIDLFGAGIPLAISLILIAIMIHRTAGEKSNSKLLYYFLLMVGIAFVATIDYTVYDIMYGGLEVSTIWILFTAILPASVIQFLFDKKDSKKLGNISLPIMKSYVVGTFGMVLSDLIRTFSGIVKVSPQIIGAGQWRDGVFQNGLWLMAGYFILSLIYTAWLERSQLSTKSFWLGS